MDKKSNLFLLVYGIFLLGSAVFLNDEMLYKVVLAATISGLFFTFSDFLLSNGYKLKKEVDSLKETSYPSDSLKKIINSINRIIIIGKITFVLGDFLFLIIAIYYNEKYFIFKVFKGIGNKLTIIAFAIVMLNYWLEDWYVEKIKEKFSIYKNRE